MDDFAENMRQKIDHVLVNSILLTASSQVQFIQMLVMMEDSIKTWIPSVLWSHTLNQTPITYGYTHVDVIVNPWPLTIQSFLFKLTQTNPLMAIPG